MSTTGFFIVPEGTLSRKSKSRKSWLKISWKVQFSLLNKNQSVLHYQILATVFEFNLLLILPEFCFGREKQECLERMDTEVTEAVR